MPDPFLFSPRRLSWAGAVLLGLAFQPVALMGASFLHTPALAEDSRTQKQIALRLAALQRALAQTAIRLESMEEELRDMTGKIEESKNVSRDMEMKLEGFIKDQKARLQEQEKTFSQLLRRQNQILETAKRPLRQGSPQRRQKSSALSPSSPSSRSSIKTPASASLPDDPDDLYQKAIELLLAKKDYSAAAKAIDVFLARYPNHPKAGQALYWLGELHYVQKDFKTAATSYLESSRSYPDSARAADSMLKLGISLRALGQKEQACLTWGELDARFPKPPQRIKRRMEIEREKARCS